MRQTMKTRGELEIELKAAEGNEQRAKRKLDAYTSGVFGFADMQDPGELEELMRYVTRATNQRVRIEQEIAAFEKIGGASASGPVVKSVEGPATQLATEILQGKTDPMELLLNRRDAAATREEAPRIPEIMQAKEENTRQENSGTNSVLNSLGYGSERIAAGVLGAGEAATDFVGTTFYKGLQGIAELAKSTPFYQNWVDKDNSRDKTSVLTRLSGWAREQADKFLDNSITADYKQSIEERYQPNQAMQRAGAINETVAGLLPGIGASKVVSTLGKGLNAANQVQKGANAGKALFGLQVAGNSANEAKAEGASTGQALAYGGVSGLLGSTIEGLTGGIPGLGSGELTQSVRGPVLSKALDILGEGGEEAASAFLSPYLKRAVYDKDAKNAGAGEIANSALLGMAASGTLQAGLELPGALGGLKSGGQVDAVAAQYAKELKGLQKKKALSALEAAYENNVGGIALPNSGLDASGLTGYDGQKEVGVHGRGEEDAVDPRAVYGRNVRGQGGDTRVDAGISGSGETKVGRIWSQTEGTGVVDWARGHIVQEPLNSASATAKSRAEEYVMDVFVVEDTALKERRNNRDVWATTNQGIIYISDSLPEDLADVVGFHEVVHVVKQRGSTEYKDFLNHLDEQIDFRNAKPLDIILKGRFGEKDLLKLDDTQMKNLYDELNAVIWGFHKADPENARAQFAGMFKDYDGYITQLDAIMEEFKIFNWGQWDD